MQIRPVVKSLPRSSTAIELRCHAPFAVGVVLWRDESGRAVATVVAKATYKLAPGTSAMLDKPDPIRHQDEYWDDGAAGSLRFPSDLAPFKGAYDVLVAGSVHAKGGHPTNATTARVVVGSIEKMLEAVVPRRSERDGQLQVGPAQARFSLRYELAAAGAENPVGIDATAFTATGGHLLPQIQPANVEVGAGDYVAPIGFGPVCRSWPVRDSLLRPDDREWLRDMTGRPRPRGFDPRFFCTAPLDQRATEPFRADERLILEGLDPTHARLVTNLDGVVPVLRAVGRRRALPPLVADTLYIDTDRQIATLAFRATIPLGDEKLLLDVMAEGDDTNVLGEEATAELERSAVLRRSAAGGEGTTELDRSAFSDAASTALPFPPSSEPGRAPPAQSVDGALPFRPTSQRPPPLVSAPAKEAFVAPVAPAPPPSSTFGLSRMMPPPEARYVPAPPGSEPPTHGDRKDPFRKAFGLSDQPAPPKSPGPLPAASSAAKSTAEAAQALNGIKAALIAAGSNGGAKAASDAAIAADTRSGHASSVAAPARTTASLRRAIVDLLAFDPAVPSRLRRSKTHAPLLAAVALSRGHQKVDAPAGEQSTEDRARIDVLRVLSCGTPLDPEELNAAVEALLDDQSDFDTPLLLVEGDVRPTMDEVETLRVATELAKPLAGSNKRVQGVLAHASEVLARSLPPMSDAALGLYRQLEASTSELSLPSRHFAELVDRTLLEARSYKKRTLLGAPRIRAELTIGRLCLPIYLPESAARQLPLLSTFPLSALVEFRPREDASEPHPSALVAFALGRVLRARK